MSGARDDSFVDRYEVLRGPASISLGPVSSGGIINTVTKLPESDPFAAFELRPLAACADTEGLLSRVVPPGSPAAAAEVARLRAALAGVRAEWSAGRPARASELHAAAMPAIAATAYPPLLAEAGLLAGVLADSLGDYKAAAARFEEALWTAEIHRHEQVATEAAIRLYFETGYRLTRLEEAGLWERHAAAALARRGGRELEIRLLSSRTTVASRAGKHEEARVLGEQALAAAREVFGAQHFEVANLLNNLGSFAGARGDHARASAYLSQSLQLQESLLGPEHPDVAVICANAGSAAVADGDRVRGRALLERALLLTRRAQGPEHPEIARILNNLAGLESSAGEFAAAVLDADAHARLLRVLGARDGLAADGVDRDQGDLPSSEGESP